MVRPSTLFEDPDTLMLRVSDDQAVVAPGPRRAHLPSGIAILAALTALAYTALILARFWR